MLGRLLFPQPLHFVEPLGPRTSALARLCAPMPLPMVSGLSMGLRTRSKFVLSLLVSCFFLYYIFSSPGEPNFAPAPLTAKPATSPQKDSVENAPSVNLAAEMPHQAKKIEDASLRKPAAVLKSPKVPEGFDPALTPVVNSFLNGKLPKSITGRSLSRVYEWAQKAEQADLAARNAYDVAIDTKAMLFISAATGMSDLIDRYWQTHKLHYNASVQLAAAERVREFMANPEFAISSPDVSLQPPAKTPICLVATYDGQTEDFPEYATVLVDSVTRNAPYADLKIFVHNTTKESFPLTLQRPNVKIVDVGQIDASYVYRGFPGLATDKLCKLMGKGSPTDPALGWADQDVECELLERRLRDFAGNGGRAIEQLRGHWGNIFQDWISPERCDSWGWLDTSTAVGDLKRWMDNPLIRDADILTAHEGDDWRLYLRNSFTVHNYRKSPEVVSNLWKRCSSIATIPALLETFQRADDWLSITEGCYSYGAISQPSVKTVLAPWQLPSWADTRLLILNDGHANYCVGENNGEICRGWVRGFMEESKKKEQKQIAADRAARIAGERIPSEGTYHRVANDIFSHPPMSDVEETLAPPSIQCAPWLPLEYNLCLDKPEHKPTEKGSTYVQVIKTDSTGTTSISCLSYTLPSDGVGMEVVAGSRGVGETLIVKFLDWATKPPSESRTKKDRLDLKIERTWFYTSKSGSIQISPGKIMMHTMKGWW